MQALVSLLQVKFVTGIGLFILIFSAGAEETKPERFQRLAETTGTNAPVTFEEITFDQFLNRVVAENLDYAAQTFNVSIAQASIAAAKEFSNPILQVTGSKDVTHTGSQAMPSTVGASLVQTIEVGSKRKYRILGAKQQYAAAASTLEDFLRNLKLDASAAFADALATSRSAEQKRESAKYLTRLADAQRERRRFGDISQADMLQVQVEEQQFQNEVLAVEAEAQKASLELCSFLGREGAHANLVAKGNLDIPVRNVDVSSLLSDALRNRPDLVALRHARDAAQSKISEERANRIPNVDLGPSWTHNTSSQNSIAPSPEFDSLGLSLSLPIPLWNHNRAAISSARYSADQAQKQLESAELKTEVQIREAASAYRNAVERVRHYQSGILKDAADVLEAKRFSYQRGQSSLLELLDAQRTDNEVRAAYNDALADQAKALIELQRAAGKSEIKF